MIWGVWEEQMNGCTFPIGGLWRRCRMVPNWCVMVRWAFVVSWINPLNLSDSWWPVDYKHLYRGHAASPKHGKNDPMVKPDKQMCGSSLWRLNSSSFQYGGEKKKIVHISLFLNDSWKQEKVHITPRMYIYMNPQRHSSIISEALWVRDGTSPTGGSRRKTGLS